MERQATVLELEIATLEHERNFHRTREFQEQAARERLGLALPGESVLIMPPNSEEARNRDQTTTDVSASDGETSNFVQWMNFLFGANQNNLNG